MKKIVEIKRGEPVPSDSRWIKDFQKELVVGEEAWGSFTKPIYEYVTYDVWEVEEDGKSK